jgi:hypothetical protein
MSMGMGEAIGAGPEVAEQFFKGNYAKKNTRFKEIAAQDFLLLLFFLNFCCRPCFIVLKICCKKQTPDTHFACILLTFYIKNNHQKVVLNAYI